MLFAKTKKYQLPVKLFVTEGLKLVLARWWYAFLVPVAIILLSFIWPGGTGWFIGGAVLLTVLYVGFWLVQLYGVSVHPQGKTMFDRFWYEFHNQSIYLKKNDREGMEIKYEMLSGVKRTDQGYFLYMGKLQFLYVPLEVFNSPNDIKFTDMLLKRKGLLKEEGAEKA